MTEIYMCVIFYWIKVTWGWFGGGVVEVILLCSTKHKCVQVEGKYRYSCITPQKKNWEKLEVDHVEGKRKTCWWFLVKKKKKKKLYGKSQDKINKNKKLLKSFQVQGVAKSFTSLKRFCLNSIRNWIRYRSHEKMNLTVWRGQKFCFKRLY